MNRDILREIHYLSSEVHMTRAVAWCAVAGAVEWLPARVACTILAASCVAKSFGAFVKGERV